MHLEEDRNGKAEWALGVEHKGAGWTELGWGVCPTGERAEDALALVICSRNAPRGRLRELAYAHR